MQFSGSGVVLEWRLDTWTGAFPHNLLVSKLRQQLPHISKSLHANNYTFSLTTYRRTDN